MFDRPDVQGAPIITSNPSCAAGPLEAETTRRLASVVAMYSAGLPAACESIFRLNELLSVTPIDLRAVNETVRKDPSIAAHVLQVANQCSVPDDAVYRLAECIVLVGAGRLRNLVLTTAMAPNEPLMAARLQALWQHCELTSIIAERIAHECGHPEPERAHMAGLLHDVGKIPDLIAGAGMPGHSSSQTEHCLIGSWLGAIWKFPSFLVDAIEHHHTPEAARRDPFLVAITAVADQFCCACGVGLQCESADPLSITDAEKLLSRHLPCLSQQRRSALANVLQNEFLRWVESPSIPADCAQPLQSSIG